MLPNRFCPASRRTKFEYRLPEEGITAWVLFHRRLFVTQRRKNFRCSLIALRGILNPRIEDGSARFEELAGIARHNCKPMVQPGCSNDEIGL
jgi:hypothetical protein